jgi:anti-anti-sigma factor
LEIHIDRESGVLVIAPVGEIDMDSGGLLFEALTAAISTGESRLVIDLGQVTFMDSTALSIFSSTRQALREVSGRLVLVIDEAQPLPVPLTWLDSFTVRPSMADAVAAVQAPG